jgi:hypothetical protein
MSHTLPAIAAALVVLAIAAAAGSPQRRDAQPTAARAERVTNGIWGGEHVRLEVTDTGATIEYDCGSGTIDEPLVLDRSRRFAVGGHHVPGRGGPVRREEPPPAAARYTGRVTGTTMTLTVTVEGNKDPYGTFTLSHGADVALMTCR